MEAESVCGKFEQHPHRKLCNECRHLKEVHALDEEDVQNIQNTIASLVKDSEGSEQRSDTEYAWIPNGCPTDRLEEYFKNFDEEKVPKYKTEGITYRLKQILKQIPPTDVSEANCRFLESEFKLEFQAHGEKIRSKAIQFGFVKVWKEGMPLQCPTCLVILEEHELVVVPSDVSSVVYHPSCFICCICHEQLVDLVHCSKVAGSIYCIRHYSETLKKRCRTCDELIFASRFSQAGEEFYHKDHVRCYNCDELMESKSFSNDGELYCTSCYEEMFSNDCEKCGERITVDGRNVTFDGKCWHYKCFTCESCGEVITDFEQHEGKFYCGKCYIQSYAPKCSHCKEVFEEKTKVVKHEGNIYHVKCFKCADCQDVIGTGTFIPHGNHAYCRRCHLKNFGVRCCQCLCPITDDSGIMYNKKPYHVKCFTCFRCLKQMAEEQFEQVEDNLFCLSCYGELFCKKCHICDKPIILGEKGVMYSYENYRWHSECFTCNVCNQSLEETSFIIHETHLTCRGCSSQEDTLSGEKDRKEVKDKKSSGRTEKGNEVKHKTSSERRTEKDNKEVKHEASSERTEKDNKVKDKTSSERTEKDNKDVKHETSSERTEKDNKEVKDKTSSGRTKEDNKEVKPKTSSQKRTKKDSKEMKDKTSTERTMKESKEEKSKKDKDYKKKH